MINLNIPKINFINKIRSNTVTNTKPILFKGYGDTFEWNSEISKLKYEFKNSLNSKKSELYSYLDNITINNDKNGFNGSINQIISEILDIDNIKSEKITSLMHKTDSGNVENIVQNGFNKDKISGTDYGPGIYFGTSEGALLIYSGDMLLADFEGQVCKPKQDMQKINKLSNVITQELAKYLNFGNQYSKELMAKYEITKNYANEYIRNKIVTEFKIDGIPINNTEGYFLVLNPECISNISLRNY